MSAEYVVIFGVLVSLFGSLLYIVSTLQGRTKPNRVTAFIWGFAGMIAFFAELSDGVGWASLPVFMNGFIPLLVFFASFWNAQAYWKLGRFDYACGALSILALVLWAGTGNPALAIFFAILADALACLPTVVKTWHFPNTEYWTGYAGAIVSAATTFFVAKSFTFTTVAFPIYIIIACSVILFCIFRKRFQRIFSF